MSKRNNSSFFFCNLIEIIGDFYYICSNLYLKNIFILTNNIYNYEEIIA